MCGRDKKKQRKEEKENKEGKRKECFVEVR